MTDPDVAAIRAALAKLRDAESPAEKNSAKATANTVGQRAALTITDADARQQFVQSLQTDINDAYSA